MGKYDSDGSSGLVLGRGCSCSGDSSYYSGLGTTDFKIRYNTIKDLKTPFSYEKSAVRLIS